MREAYSKPPTVSIRTLCKAVGLCYNPSVIEENMG